MSKAIPQTGLAAHCTSLHKHWDRSVPPAHVVASGATLAMTCPDASNGLLSASSSSADIATIDFSHLDPLCGPIFIGSSSNTGEGCSYFQEEVFLVSIAVGPALDDLDGVVDAFEDAGMQRMSTARQNAVQIGFQPLRKAH